MEEKNSQNAAYHVALELADADTPLEMKIIPRGNNGWGQLVIFPGGQKYDIQGKYEIETTEKQREQVRQKHTKLNQRVDQVAEATWGEER